MLKIKRSLSKSLGGLIVSKGSYTIFTNFLMDNGILVLEDDKRFTTSKIIDTEKACEHIKVLNKFHIASKGYVDSIFERLPNGLGTEVEEMKVLLKVLIREQKKLNKYESLSELEQEVLNEIENYINKAHKAIELISNCNYHSLLRRSMRNYEICLYKVFESNIRMDNMIVIKSLSKVQYNMLEIDAYNYLYKLKKQRIDIDYNKVIEKFCVIENLSYESYKFVCGMLSFPLEFSKFVWKNNRDYKQLDDEELIEKMRKAIAIDNML